MFQHVRLAVRTLRKNPSFAALAVLTLAVGIGATTAMFSLVEAVSLRPLDYANAARIVQLNTSQRGRTFPRLTGPDFVDIAAGASSLDRMSFYMGGELGVQLPAHADFAGAYFVSPHFFSVLGITPALGRDFVLDDANRAALVSGAFALRNFATGTAALGQTLRVEGVAYQIVGIMALSTSICAPGSSSKMRSRSCGS